MHADAHISLDDSDALDMPRRERAPIGPSARARPLALTLAADHDAPKLARHAVAAVLRLWPQERRESALLVVSELVTNAVRHGSVDDRDAIGLHVRPRGTTTRIEVIDARAGAAGSEPAAADGERKRSGWGLPIVTELTDRWGIERGARHTCVWCEIDDR